MVFKINFDIADRDHNGSLNAAEFLAALQNLARKYDTNGDGKLSDYEITDDVRSVFKNGTQSIDYASSLGMDNTYAINAWKQLNGTTRVEYAGLTGLYLPKIKWDNEISKDDVRKSGATFIQFD